MMARPESLAGIDLDRHVVKLDLVAVMRSMHQEAAGAHGRQSFKRLGNPVDLRNDLPLDTEVGKVWSKHFGQPLAELILFLER